MAGECSAGAGRLSAATLVPAPRCQLNLPLTPGFQYGPHRWRCCVQQCRTRQSRLHNRAKCCGFESEAPYGVRRDAVAGTCMCKVGSSRWTFIRPRKPDEDLHRACSIRDKSRAAVALQSIPCGVAGAIGTDRRTPGSALRDSLHMGLSDPRMPVCIDSCIGLLGNLPVQTQAFLSCRLAAARPHSTGRRPRMFSRPSPDPTV